MNNLLVVDDDPDIIRLLEISFRAVNFEVFSTSKVTQVAPLMEEIKPSAIILDISLPDGNGMDLISLIRSNSDVPILMLSARSTDLEKVSSLTLGADDYVVKPFSLAELTARVQRLIQRYNQQSLDHKLHDHAPKTYTGLQLYPDEHRVIVGENELKLTNQEFRLLETLLENQGKTVLKTKIFEKLWGKDNLIVETRAIDACVSRLRKKLRASLGENPIITVTGVGYRLPNA